MYANKFCDAGQVPIFRNFEACPKYCLVKLAQEKSVVRWTDRPDMTFIAIDWDIKNQTKQTKRKKKSCVTSKTRNIFEKNIWLHFNYGICFFIGYAINRFV